MLHWTLHLKGGRYNNAAVVVGLKVYHFGRANPFNCDQIEVHIFNQVSLRWRILPPETMGRGERPLEVPSRHAGKTAVLIEDTVYLWGGMTNPGRCNVLHAFDVDARTWFKPQVSGTVPEGRENHSACVLEKAMYIHGGITQPRGRTNDIYKLDTSTMVWSLINTRGTAPSVSSSHSATIIGTKMFVFGGFSGLEQKVYYNTIRVFDTETNLWVSTHSAQILPEGRFGHSAFAYNGELYIFGGNNNSNQIFNLWKFNPETFSWSQVEPKGKSPCTKSWMVCCCMGDLIILFGGNDRSDELFILDFSPSLKMLCKLSVIQYGLEQSELPHDIKWELAAMTSNN